MNFRKFTLGLTTLCVVILAVQAFPKHDDPSKAIYSDESGESANEGTII